MKKIYSTPAIYVVDIELQSLVAASIRQESGNINANITGAESASGIAADAAEYRSNLWE